MNYHISSQRNFHSIITPEQLNQIIAAITEGRYSWACVLILRFVGYNPLHFIPQRTYSRLIKENSQVSSVPLSTTGKTPISINSSVNTSSNLASSQVVNKINDLNYLETSDEKQASLENANVPLYLETKITTLYSSKSHRAHN
ncbi:HetP family heterocyst commitment protein [Dendronalium sp. ChiSLP03b]|uniref:HetP family heterocyst commitment protein n=1 Tax=Dendronalium sp. ChiSLP03b TaxID=3075381 RepID=UPI002AD46E9B|nr:HetP family heterocyst commitment protein [Dendronalium sp. ChiSLP03b]MDZ8208579.1 HetP family heterocyst commitment protein [Dendronalium sp. ChiSLP03b]